MMITSTQPTIIASRRFSSDRSMNVGGAEDRRVDVDALSPGRRASSAFSTSLVTSSVLPVGCFSTIRSRPSPSLITASPIGGGKPTLILGDVAQPQAAPRCGTRR